MSNNEVVAQVGNSPGPVIDRRLSGKNKSIGNREHFKRRYKEQIREAVDRAINSRKIKDVSGSGEEIRIPRKDISEPVFGHGPGGKRDIVHPGNREYIQGDHIERPKGGGGGSGKGQASDTGEGQDDFAFTLSKEEFMEVFFEGLALPDMIRMTIADTTEWKWQRAGIVSDGTPTNLHLVRSMRNKIGRGIAWGKKKSEREHARLTERLLVLRAFAPRHEWEQDIVDREIVEIEVLLDILEARIDRVHLDPHDLRYRARTKVPQPYSKAVMFCLMDVSGSMDENRKDLAKRFFILLYLFLTRHYEKIELVFIRHHTQALVVDEEDFFHAKETGGTVVSSALVLMDEVIKGKHPDYPGGFSPSEWNIYGAQSSDGDNWHHDSGRCVELLREQVLPPCRYFAYLQVAEEEQNLWEEYMKLAKGEKKFAMKKALKQDQIYPVFRELFTAKEAGS